MYITMIISVVIGIYSSRVILITLGISDFGIYSLIGGLVSFFTFLNATMSGAVQRFLSASLGKKDIKETTELFSTAIIVHLVIAVFILIATKTIGEWFLVNKLSIPPLRESAAYWVFQTVVIVFLFQIVMAPAQAMLTSYEKMGTVAFITFITPVGKLVSIILAGLMPFDKLITFACSISLFGFIQLFLSYLFARYKCEAFSFVIPRDKEKYKALTSFAGWGLFGDLSVLLKSMITSVFLNIFFGTVANASFGVSNQIIANFRNFSTTVTRAANPQITKSFISGDRNKSYKLVTQLSKISFSTLFIISLPFLLQTDWILTLWLKDVPQYAVIFSQWAIVVVLIEISSFPLMSLSRATGRITLYQIVVSSFVIPSLLIVYLVFMKGGSPEAMYSVYAVFAVITLFVRLIILNRTSGISVFSFLKGAVFKAVVIVVVVMILAFLPPYYIEFSTNLLRFYHILLIPFITALISYFYVLSKTERYLISKTFSKKNR